MFISNLISTCLLTCLSESLEFKQFSGGATQSNASTVDVNPLSTGISQGISNFQAKINPFFSPDRFKFFFGDNAVQTIDSIAIQKSDIPFLTPDANNTAESLLVGILGIALSGKNVCEFPGMKFYYWGTGKINGLSITTVLISFYNSLMSDANNDTDMSSFDDAINPNIY
jgi:hypothetical protein